MDERAGGLRAAQNPLQPLSALADQGPWVRLIEAPVRLDNCRLKDFRRVATRNDRCDANFLAAVIIDATASCWL